jgi:hypothetical protein
VSRIVGAFVQGLDLGLVAAEGTFSQVRQLARDTGREMLAGSSSDTAEVDN